MKARNIIPRELNSNTFATGGGGNYPKYFAYSKGNVLFGYEIVKSGVLMKGDYYFNVIKAGIGKEWIQALGACGDSIHAFNEVCRPKNQLK